MQTQRQINCDFAESIDSRVNGVKRCILATLLLLLPLVSTLRAATVTGNLLLATGSASPDRRVTFTALDTPADTSSGTIFQTSTTVTTSGGIFTVSLVQGAYRISIDGVNWRRICVPAGSGTYSVHSGDLNCQTGVGIYLGDIHELLVAGTNVVFTTNSSGVVTINTTGGGSGSGSLTNVAVSTGTGLQVSGSPITGGSGTVTVSPANDLAALEAMSGTGLLSRTGSETYAQRTLMVGSSKLTLSNGNGVSGNPTFDLGTVAIGDITGLQTSLDGKQPLITSASNLEANNVTIHGALQVNGDGENAADALTLTNSLALLNLTPSRALVSDANKRVTNSAVTTTELGYLSGVTSALQTQVDSKANAGAITSSGLTMTGPGIIGRTNGTGPLQILSTGNIYNVADYGIVPDGTDQALKVSVLLTNVANAGGGIVKFNIGEYLLTNKIEIPNIISEGIAPKQVPIRITGAGLHWTGQSAVPLGGTILNMTFTTSSNTAKIMTRGLGRLEIDNLTMKDQTTSGQTPFVKTIMTTLSIHDVGFFGQGGGTNCIQDCIVLGGVGVSDFVSGGDNASFQGYGTLIFNNYFNRIRTGVIAHEHSNGNVIRNNTFWSQCGGMAGAIVLTTNNFGGTCTGNIVAENLIEMSNYYKGIDCTNATMATFYANHFYDPPAWQATAYRIDRGHAFISGGFISQPLTQVELVNGGVASHYTVEPGTTNLVSNNQLFSSPVDFKASVPFRLLDNGSDAYHHKTINTGGYFDLFTPAGGSSETMARWVRVSSTATQLKLGGSSSADIYGDGDIHVYAGGSGKTLWLGSDSSEQHFITGGNFYGSKQGTTFRSALGGSYEWSGTSSATAGAAAMWCWTNSLLNAYGATRFTTWVPVVAKNLPAPLAAGGTTFIDLSFASRTNEVTGALTFAHATNGLDGFRLEHERVFYVPSGGPHTLTIPATWRTNAVSEVPPALTNGTITIMHLKSFGDTSSAALQTNVYVRFEYYK